MWYVCVFSWAAMTRALVIALSSIHTRSQWDEQISFMDILIWNVLPATNHSRYYTSISDWILTPRKDCPRKVWNSCLLYNPFEQGAETKLIHDNLFKNCEFWRIFPVFISSQIHTSTCVLKSCFISSQRKRLKYIEKLTLPHFLLN